MKKFRYQNIFMYSSLQFCGHVEEYFAENTKKLVVFIVMPRLKNEYNLVRHYRRGRLIEEKKVWSSSNFFLYYLAWWLHHWWILLKYFQKNEEFFVLCGHPMALFGMRWQKWLRKTTFAYWIGDYFPSVNLSLRLFERIKKFYHDRITYTCYLGDRINQKLNGKILQTKTRKTVMWGVKPRLIERSPPQKKFTFLFVGLVKASQGLELFYKFLKENSDYSLKIIGICDEILYLKHQKLIKKYGINNQVYFPNKFFSDEELEEISKTCHLGVALYKTGKKSATYYTDPGKVKQYTELGLPVIMSHTSAIADYLKKFKAGELVKRNLESIKNGIEKITRHYQEYSAGVEKFNQYFAYHQYYHRAFKFMEEIASANAQ